MDATPPVGSMMAYDKVVRQDDLPLRCRGVVLIGGEPIVLCAVDWIGLANEGHEAQRLWPRARQMGPCGVAYAAPA